MSDTKCVIVVGYNGSRVMDIGKLRGIVQARYNAQLALLVETKTDHDEQVADDVWALSFNQSDLHTSLNKVHEYLQSGRELIGVLPFSDRGVLLGAAIATYYQLPGIKPTEALAGLDKSVFRRLEGQHPAPPAYDPLPSYAVDGLQALIERVQSLGGSAFIKPACEGASRGCQVIEHVAHCADAWRALRPYHATGVIVEALVNHAPEYSWDYVAGCSWVTEKTTTEGAYRAEIQQIVPAPLPPEHANRIREAGEHMRYLVAPNNGAYHNEVFFKSDLRTSAVETNMRPGGMHIWDLAQHAFDGFDPWDTWIRWAVEGHHQDRPLTARGYCGIRLLRARKDGSLNALPDLQALAFQLDIDLIEGVYTKKIGDSVSATVTDNMAFVGHITVFHTDADCLKAQLSTLAESAEARIEVELSSITAYA